MKKTHTIMAIGLALVVLFGLLSCQSKPPVETSSVEAAQEQPAVVSKQPPKPVTDIPAGTPLRVRLNQSLDTERNRAGDTFTATLDAPVMAGEKVAIPKGTQFMGHVTSAKPSGRLKGRGYLSVTLDSFEWKGGTYRVATSTNTSATGSHKKRNVALIGGGSGVGAVIGGLAGGGKGAAIGAAAGAAAGTAGAAATGEKDASMPAETVLRFTLEEPIQIRG